MADDAFLQAILDNPQDDSPRLIYADWLEEQGDPVSQAKAEFLRLTAEIAMPGKPKEWQEARHKRLQQLAAALDTAWLGVVSRLAIENCDGKRREQLAQRRWGLVRFDFLCDRRWEDLNPTDDRAVRFCDGCLQNVHYCDTIMEARTHAEAGHCIAVDVGVIRRERDLEPQMLVVGMPGPDFLRREEERTTPDPVSAERERRKQQAATTDEGTAR